MSFVFKVIAGLHGLFSSISTETSPLNTTAERIEKMRTMDDVDYVAKNLKNFSILYPDQQLFVMRELLFHDDLNDDARRILIETLSDKIGEVPNDIMLLKMQLQGTSNTLQPTNADPLKL